jgi:hypothetical protein
VGSSISYKSGILDERFQFLLTPSLEPNQDLLESPTISSWLKGAKIYKSLNL